MPPGCDSRGLPAPRPLSACVPGFDPRMFAHGIVHAHEFGVGGENGGGDVVDVAAEEPAHGHVELHVDDVDVLAGEARSAGDVAFCVSVRPRTSLTGLCFRI